MKMTFIVVEIALGLFMADAANARAPRFTRSTGTNQPVVADNVTGLMWQGCHAGYSGDACTTSLPGDTPQKSWSEALRYCEESEWGGYNDWRLPNIKELMSIVDRRRSAPAIDTEAFPGTPGSYFWSSSSVAGHPVHAWGVNFLVGYVHGYDKSDTYSVRCVRSGP